MLRRTVRYTLWAHGEDEVRLEEVHTEDPPGREVDRLEVTPGPYMCGEIVSTIPLERVDNCYPHAAEYDLAESVLSTVFGAPLETGGEYD